MKSVYESLRAAFFEQASRPWTLHQSEFDNGDTISFKCGGDLLSVCTDVGMAFLYEGHDDRPVFGDSSSVSIRFRNADEFAAFRKALGQ